MGCLELTSIKENNTDKKTTVMIFTEGTVLRPKNALQFFNVASYIPIKNSVNIIKSWVEQSAEIVYCTSRKNLKEVNEVKDIFMKYNFMGSRLYYREKDQEYKDLVELVLPHILIEDDCRSIGGKNQMCITHVDAAVKDKIKSIPVREFEGIDDLPLSLTDLLIWNKVYK